ncbi:MAG: ABC transporter ATP-binding protein/permease, partial [Treponema sp.]|nr:ABC transporter ATP-binding protein/permease [Treponema sp.]
MVNLKTTLGLSDDGYRNGKRAIFAVVITNLTHLLSFAVIIQTIITLLDPLMSGTALDRTRLWFLFGLGLVSALVYFLAYRNEYRKTYTAAYRESERIRLEVAEHIRRLPLSFFNNKDLSELTTTMMADCTAIEHTMSHVVPGLYGNIITVTVVCLCLGFYDWRMALALFAALPLAFALILGSRKLQELLGERLVVAKLAVSDYLQEYLEGIKVVKAFGLAGEKAETLEGALKAMMRIAMRFEGMAGIGITLAMTILHVGIGLVVLTGVSRVTGGSIGVIPLLMFILISARIYAPLLIVLTLLPEFFFYLVSTKRMQQLRREPAMTGAEALTLKDHTIELKNVSFAYRDQDVLNHFSLTIPSGRVTALVGPSGSGKTTVSRLIARFWDVREGEILIGGVNIRSIDPEVLMGYMSFVFQDVVLFNDTVMNTIRIGKAGASDEAVYAAARTARCDEFIRKLPEGYDTVIGENGSTLSGGER